MRTVGIDLSLTSTGLATWDGSEVLDYQGVKTGAHDHDTDGERFAYIVDRIMAFVQEWGPHLIGLEAQAHSMGENRIAKISGALEVELYRLGLDYILVAPNTLKKYATGYGRSSKDEMEEAAREFLPECPNDDIADAVHLARFTYDHLEDYQED